MKLIIMLAFAFALVFGSIDINSASADELSRLKGIGTSKASAIVKYRSVHCFKSIDELANVKGIGSMTIKNNKANLSLGECK